MTELKPSFYNNKRFSNNVESQERINTLQNYLDVDSSYQNLVLGDVDASTFSNNWFNKFKNQDDHQGIKDY